MVIRFRFSRKHMKKPFIMEFEFIKDFDRNVLAEKNRVYKKQLTFNQKFQSKFIFKTLHENKC